MGISSDVEKTALLVGSRNWKTGTEISAALPARVAVASHTASQQLRTAAKRLKGNRRLDAPGRACVLRVFIGCVSNSVCLGEGKSSAFSGLREDLPSTVT